MHRHLALIGLALLLCCGLSTRPAGAVDESIVGKWNVVAETPDGQLSLEFEFKQDGTKLKGVAVADQGNGEFAAVRFEHPNFAGELEIGGGVYRLNGSLKDGKLSGTWEQVGGDMKGTWAAMRSSQPAPAPAATAATTGISGLWESLAVTPNGDMSAVLELKQEGDKLTGEIRSDMGALPIQAASYKDDKLQFDLDLGGNTYRIQATLKEGKLVGGWAPAAGGDGGAWSATRKASPPAPVEATKPAAPAVIGSWEAVAVTPGGEVRFMIEINQPGDTLSGSVKTPDGSVSLQKLVFANEKLSFEIEYMGGLYRIEAALASDKLTGKWSAVGGSEEGALTAVRKK